MNSRWLRPGSAALDLLTAGGILLLFLLLMLAARLLWTRLIRPLVKRTDTDLDDIALPPLRGLLMWGILFTGIYQSAASLNLVRANTEIQIILSRGLSMAWVVLAVVTSLKVFNGVVTWYARTAAARPGGAGEITHQAGIVRKAVTVLVLGIGLLYLLHAAGVDISPLLASGAIGGLAVALALQDTLSNLFAGFFLAIDRPVRVGDFVRLESGEEGFVEEIGWRNTKVRPWANNLVIIPNSKLSQTVITNYYLPRQEMSVIVNCGVAYDSDLQRVEDVTIAVARDVMRRVPGSDTNWDPVVRWKEFGDSAITFVVVLRVVEFKVQYELQSEFIKALHRRYGDEGIEIPFPIRTLIVRPAAGPPAGIEGTGRLG